MNIRVGLMGFGRIGRNIFRILHGQDDIQVVAISDIAEPKAMDYLLRFDTVHGRFSGPVSVTDTDMYVKGRRIRLIKGVEPGDVPWGELNADIVLETTGRYRTRKQMEAHLATGARRVILTHPTDDRMDLVLIRGVNDADLLPEHRILSTSSVAANCAAPIIKILHEAFGVERAFLNSVHAYTNDQRLADVPHTELRRSRAAAENIIPTESWAPRSIVAVLPEMRGRLDGMAMNVPVSDGSNVDLTAEMREDVSVQAVNEVVRSAAGSTFRGIVEFMDDPIVSSDVIGSSHSAIFDSLGTMVLDGHLLKTISWFDNGWGYSCRIVEVIRRLAEMEGRR